jgi:hypothetical protein
MLRLHHILVLSSRNTLHDATTAANPNIHIAAQRRNNHAYKKSKHPITTLRAQAPNCVRGHTVQCICSKGQETYDDLLQVGLN